MYCLLKRPKINEQEAGLAHFLTIFPFPDNFRTNPEDFDRFGLNSDNVCGPRPVAARHGHVQVLQRRKIRSQRGNNQSEKMK